MGFTIAHGLIIPWAGMSIDVELIHKRIAQLDAEHRELDVMITILAEEPTIDELQLRRLKKRKLQIKDQILLLQVQLVPDIPA